MYMPEPVWEVTYSSSRRKHSHRCRACNRIVAEGARVLMAKTGDRRTQVLHLTCADQVSFGGFTQRQYLECHGHEYLAACGWQAAKAWLAASPVTKAAV